MSSFSPSTEQDLAGAGYGSSALDALNKSSAEGTSETTASPWAAIAGAAGSILSTGITLAAAGSARKAQAKQDAKTSKSNERLVALQTKLALAQGTVSNAAAASSAAEQSAATQKTLYIVGGGVAGVLVLSIVGYLIFKPSKRHHKKRQTADEDDE